MRRQLEAAIDRSGVGQLYLHEFRLPRMPLSRLPARLPVLCRRRWFAGREIAGGLRLAAENGGCTEQATTTWFLEIACAI